MLQIDRPLGLGEMLDGAFRLYRARFARLVLIAAIFLVPVGVLSTLVLGATATDFTQLLLDAGNAPVSTDFAPALGAMGAYLLVGLLGYLASGLTFVSLTSQAVGLIQGEEQTVGESIRRGLRRLPQFVGMVVVAGLAVAGVTLALYIVLFFVVFASTALLSVLGALGSDSGSSIVAVFFAIFLFLFYMAAIVAVFIPVGLLLARWAAAPALVVAEKLGPVASLSRSWQLTRHNLWRTFGYLVLLFIFNFIVLGLPLGVLQSLLVFALTTEWYFWLYGLLIGLSYVVNVVWSPFMVLALVMLYFDLRVRNESLDLEMRVRQLEESTRPGTLPS